MSASQSSVLYKQRIDQLVGDSDPRGILSSTLEDFNKLLSKLDKEPTRTISDSQWSVNDVLQHLVDAELVNGYRLRMALAAKQPELPGFDQDFWVQRFNTERSTTQILEEWRVMRNYNLRIINSITGEELKKEYRHPQRGLENVGDLLRLMAGHDLIHKQQIQSLLSR